MTGSTSITCAAKRHQENAGARSVLNTTANAEQRTWQENNNSTQLRQAAARASSGQQALKASATKGNHS